MAVPSQMESGHPSDLDGRLGNARGLVEIPPKQLLKHRFVLVAQASFCTTVVLSLESWGLDF